MNLVQDEQRVVLEGFPVLGLPDGQQAINYFSFNPFLPDEHHRCPLACGYCVCHQDGAWHHHPKRFANHDVPDNLINLLLDQVFTTPQGQMGFPISLWDYSDPFLPSQREQVLATLQSLSERRVDNMVYITTKIHPGMQFLERLHAILAQSSTLRVTVFVSLAPLRPGYEQASVDGRVRLLQDLVGLHIPACWYMRPLVEAWFDEDLMRQLMHRLLPAFSHHIILSGVMMSEEIEKVLAAHNLTVPVWDKTQPQRKQPLSPHFEQRVRTLLRDIADEMHVSLGPVLGHRICGAQGHYDYGCLQKRYCELFDLYHNDETSKAAENQRHRIQKCEHIVGDGQRDKKPPCCN